VVRRRNAPGTPSDLGSLRPLTSRLSVCGDLVERLGATLDNNLSVKSKAELDLFEVESRPSNQRPTAKPRMI